MACLLRELLNDEVGTSALAGGWPGPAEWWGGQERGREMLAWWWWRYNVRWGRVSALRFHLCNLPSIVRDYYQLFNYSDDIYQGQLYRAVSCRENGLSVLLLHSQAEECAAEAVQVGVKTFGWTCFFSGSVPTVTRVAINYPPRFQLFFFLFSFQLCLFPLVAIVFLLNTSSTSFSSVSTSWSHYSNTNTRKDWSSTFLFLATQKWTLVMHCSK